MSLATRLLGANPGVQVSSALSGSLTTPGAKGAFVPPASMEYIATATGDSSSQIMTFTSIPQTYKHLVIRGTMNANYSGPQEGAVGTRFNSDSGNNYSRHIFSAVGTGIGGGVVNATSYAQTGTALLTTSANSTHGVYVITISDYTSRSFYATASGFSGVKHSTTQGETGVYSGYWNSTSGITSLSLYQQNGAIFSNSVAHLYGIKG